MAQEVDMGASACLEAIVMHWHTGTSVRQLQLMVRSWLALLHWEHVWC